jgi:23S rRNA (adenine2503-C2)-methyltransferase
MMAGVNDSETAARELAAFVRPLNAHVNLIPLNPTPGFSTPGTDLELIHWFRDLLESFGVNATIRSNRGTDIDAACGQLRAEQQVMLRGKPQRQMA